MGQVLGGSNWIKVHGGVIKVSPFVALVGVVLSGFLFSPSFLFLLSHFSPFADGDEGRMFQSMASTTSIPL